MIARDFAKVKGALIWFTLAVTLASAALVTLAIVGFRWISGEQGALPDAVRLQIDLPASTGLRGRLTLDWVRPNFSNSKT
jgi:hypothetical protein